MGFLQAITKSRRTAVSNPLMKFIKKSAGRRAKKRGARRRK